MCYIVGMSTAAKPRQGGRPSKLTDEVQAKVVRVVKMGGSLAMAARHAGVSTEAIYEWMRRGEGHDHRRGGGARYVRFAQAVRQAEGDGDAELLASVRAQVVGLECKACENGILVTDEGPERCPACKGTGYAAKPDGRLSLDVLARRHPTHFARKDRMQVEQKVEGTVRVDVQVQALTMSLQALDASQLAALAWAEPKAIEAGADRPAERDDD